MWRGSCNLALSPAARRDIICSCYGCFCCARRRRPPPYVARRAVRGFLHHNALAAVSSPHPRPSRDVTNVTSLSRSTANEAPYLGTRDPCTGRPANQFTHSKWRRLERRGGGRFQRVGGCVGGGARISRVSEVVRHDRRLTRALPTPLLCHGCLPAAGATTTMTARTAATAAASRRGWAAASHASGDRDAHGRVAVRLHTPETTTNREGNEKDRALTRKIAHRRLTPL